MSYHKADQFEFSTGAFNLAGETYQDGPRCVANGCRNAPARRDVFCDVCRAQINARTEREQRELF